MCISLLNILLIFECITLNALQPPSPTINSYLTSANEDIINFGIESRAHTAVPVTPQQSLTFQSTPTSSLAPDNPLHGRSLTTMLVRDIEPGRNYLTGSCSEHTTTLIPEGSLIPDWTIEGQSIQGFCQRTLVDYIETEVFSGLKPKNKQDSTMKRVAIGDAVDRIKDKAPCLENMAERALVNHVINSFKVINDALNIPYEVDFSDTATNGILGVTYHSLSWMKGNASKKALAFLSGDDYNPDNQPLVTTTSDTLFHDILSLDQWYGRLSKSERIQCGHQVLIDLRDYINDMSDSGSHLDNKRPRDIKKQVKVRTSIGENVKLNIKLSTPKRAVSSLRENSKTTPPSPKLLKTCLIRDLRAAALAAIHSADDEKARLTLLLEWQAEILDLDLREINVLEKKVRLYLYPCHKKDSNRVNYALMSE